MEIINVIPRSKLTIAILSTINIFLRVVVSRIIFWTDVFQAKWTNRRNLGDVLTGFRPVEVRRVAWQNDNATGRIRLEFIGVELITKADVENAGHYCVNPILRVSVWHEFHAAEYSDPNRVGPSLRGLTDNDCQADRRWKGGEGLPVDVFGQDRSENFLALMVRSNRTLMCFHHCCFFFV